MLDKIFYKEWTKRSILKTLLFWVVYFSVIIGGTKPLKGQPLDSLARIVFLIILGILFCAGIVIAFLYILSIMTDFVCKKLEMKDEKRKQEIIKEVENLFAESVKREVTILELSDLAESSIVNELEANEEICLFAELDINRINISIKMKDGKEYPGVISYLPAKYELFLKEFEVL